MVQLLCLVSMASVLSLWPIIKSGVLSAADATRGISEITANFGKANSLFATAGIVGGIVGILLLIFTGAVFIYCWRRLNREWEREHDNLTGADDSRALENQQNEIENLADRPRSGYYEHEFYGDPNGNLSAPSGDQTGTTDNPSKSKETPNLLGSDFKDSLLDSSTPRQMIDASPS
ncbi:hypothetical protein Aperf_G00000019609 [Anoplocephala perfoliata]